MRVQRHLHTDFQTVTSALKPVVRSIRTTTAGFILSKAKHLMVALVALSAAFAMMPRQVLAEETEDPGDIVVRYLDPAKVFLFNADAELSSTDEIVVATLKYSWPKRHRLVIDFSSVGAITQSTMTSALLYLGCDVDGTACIGTQSNPPGAPAGWVNALSCETLAGQGPGGSCAQWDSHVGYVWFSRNIEAGTHTVQVKASVGFALFADGTGPGKGGPGTLFDEARNLVVTLLQ
jgi:hypothetical protein